MTSKPQDVSNKQSFELTVYHNVAERQMDIEDVVYFELGDELYVEHSDGEGEYLDAFLICGAT